MALFASSQRIIDPRAVLRRPFTRFVQLLGDSAARASLVVAALLALCVTAGESIALTGGSNLANDERHTGIFQIVARDGLVRGGTCTATVLSASEATNRTWLVTAAHCFSNRDRLFFVWGHFSNPRAQVRYREVDGVGNQTTRRSGTWESRVYVHPEWLNHGGHSSRRGRAKRPSTCSPRKGSGSTHSRRSRICSSSFPTRPA